MSLLYMLSGKGSMILVTCYSRFILAKTLLFLNERFHLLVEITGGGEFF